MQFIVTQDQDGLRLDKLLARVGEVSRRQARLWIATGQVRANGRLLRILTRPMSSGTRLEVAPQGGLAEAATKPMPPCASQHLPVDIIYLDRWLVAVNKPARLLSEHDRFGSPSLESIVPKMLQARGEQSRLWLVHRLDAGTSGVLVMARTPMAAAALSAVFREARAQKTYLALCVGGPEASVQVDAPIGRAAGTRHQVRADGKPAQTHIATLASGPHAALVRLRPRTGRTHQIRVHMQHLGHPLLGDALYGGPRVTKPLQHEAVQSIDRCMLHAASLSLPHPKHDERLFFDAPLPADFKGAAAAFGIDLVKA